MTNRIGIIITALLSFILGSFLFSWPVMMLWNGCLVDSVAGVKDISWLQAWGLSVLCGLLFNKASVKSND